MASTHGRDDKVAALRALPWARGASDDDLRWLARVADGFARSAGSTVARATTPSRWAYVVVSGTVAGHGPGAVLLPDADLVADTAAEVLAFPRAEEAHLHRRFPDLVAPAPVRPSHRCPISRAIALPV